MIFLSPIWLLLAIPMGISLWLLKSPSRFIQVTRIIIIALILFALAGLAIKLPSRAGTIVVVADSSGSMPANSSQRQEEAIRLVLSEMHDENNLAVVTFGEKVALERPPQKGGFNEFSLDAGSDASNLSDALEMATSLISENNSGRILVLSDGRWTGTNPEGIASEAIMRNIPIDYRLIERPCADDLAIMNIDSPRVVNSGQSYMVNVWVKSPRKQEVSYRLIKNSSPIIAGKTNLVTGTNRLTFRDKAVVAGTIKYEFQIFGDSLDPVPENNTAKMLLGVEGEKPLLCVSETKGLSEVLGASGINTVFKKPQQCQWEIDDLSSFSSILLEDIPASKIGSTGMGNIAMWIKDTGSGLMITGGEHSYGPGGYYKSPLEAIMPVSMELRREHRKLSIAIAIVLDRSGSMAVPVAGGKTKMDLANIASAQVLDMLSPMDEIGVIAVDSAAHTIVGLASVEENLKYRNKILSIDSMGGGIFVYEGLAHAAKMLANSNPQTRHIILFADAADAEEPGKYKELLANCEKAGMTVSVIGLGKPTDVDSALLEDIAKCGNGRCFFTENPAELPRLFAQDTFVVARSTFIKEPVAIKSTAALLGLTGRSFDFPQPIGGYNLCYARTGADLGVVSLDEYKAPIVAAWQVGVGRVLCYSAQANGEFTGDFMKWNEAGSFLSSLGKWVVGEDSLLGEDMLLTQNLFNGNCVIELHLAPNRKRDLDDLPKVTTLFGSPGVKPESTSMQMQYKDADTLIVEFPLRGANTYLSTINVEQNKTVTMSPVCLPYSPEFKQDENSRGEFTLRRLAESTCGVERISLGEIWRDIPVRIQLIPIGRYLAIAAILLLLIEIFERRTALFSQYSNMKSRKINFTKILKATRVNLLNKKAKSTFSKNVSNKNKVQFDKTKTTSTPKREDGLIDAFAKAQKFASNRTRKNSK